MTRLSGLAVAFGIGAAVALACAGEASASPDDPGNGRGRHTASAAGSEDHGSRAGSARRTREGEAPAPDRGERRKSFSPNADSAADPARPKPAATVRTARRAPVAAAVDPAPVAREAREAPAADVPKAVTPPLVTPPAAPPPTAAAQTQPVQPTLFDPRGHLVTIYKGTHFAIPNPWAIWVRKVSGDATFTADSRYDLEDEDQYDWNKLAGITFTPWRPERDAGMVVWRYNLQNQMYEVGPFFDVDFAYVFPTDDEIISIPAGATFDYAVDYDGITVSYGDRSVHKPLPQDLRPNFWTSARVTGWFGGSEVAPRTVSYYLHMR